MVVAELEPRIIPAYAGSTGQHWARRRGEPDHPRIRGEHCIKICNELESNGIIPAYAGSTAARASHRAPTTDHPRIRGEHTAALIGPAVAGGSSPHTRGALASAAAGAGAAGIIPAYAGSTKTRSPGFMSARDHPRIRGEHTWKSLQYQGSPP